MPLKSLRLGRTKAAKISVGHVWDIFQTHMSAKLGSWLGSQGKGGNLVMSKWDSCVFLKRKSQLVPDRAQSRFLCFDLSNKRSKSTYINQALIGLNPFMGISKINAWNLNFINCLRGDTREDLTPTRPPGQRRGFPSDSGRILGPKYK